ncbi:hypothetical protein SLS62_008000 [Diatrype stigma]|uniref:Uncharacterized protein n=1 Tax=Diatrype stigma TaxID=117547 RepID=A0AAN9UKL1_9PEZI
MAPPPIVKATIQSAVLAATSNFLAQALMAYRNETSLVLDWVPMFQFILFAFISTPPNFLWQEFLESTYPAYKATAGTSAAEKKEQKQEQAPKLSKGNTAAKFVLDQTVGAAANTFLFSVFIHSIQAAMAVSSGSAGGVVGLDYSKVDWTHVLARSRAEFAALVVAGWRLWPLVSLVNFTLVKTVEGRNLVGGLAGVAWGVYMSLVAAGS